MKTYETVKGKPKMTKQYNQWFDMTQRAKSKRVKASRPNYSSVRIDPSWNSYDTWYAWALTQQGFMQQDLHGKFFQIDKDLLGDGILYAPHTCVFIPAEINKALIISCKGCQILPNGKFRAVGFKKSKAVSLGCFTDQDDAFEALASFRKANLIEITAKYEDVLAPQTLAALRKYDFLQAIKGKQ